MEPEEVYELNEQIQMEMDVGFEIKNKIIPRAVEWFTGEAVEDDSDDEDDEDEDEVRLPARRAAVRSGDARGFVLAGPSRRLQIRHPCARAPSPLTAPLRRLRHPPAG